ncbi:MAG TPA: ABC transporter ATP-binding protein [Candidatus Latescibacteria bacterium]|jgi:ABC-2 type transport system ATP-binding protein|nr:ABC transporter ATP-binding protein [Gemmatimonadaceae bacterium]MDP6018431.1 ABC transporter ATP-binding protein [Candidatus Latescibacterota bacterium]HJP30009.1 ABC transporter ATP-binding protein [Candidatus Latescibacterota bacterium]
MLEILDMSKHYGDVHAVNNLTLTIEPGEIFTMLGANGAGKTTTLMVSLGFTEPTNGTVKICGIDVTRDPLEAKKHVAYVSENVMLYGNFTARQNLEFFTKLGGRKDVTDAEYENVMDRVGLQRDAFERRVKGFSKGMRQKLGIAIAIMKNAEVILLDEPTSGLDPKSGAEFLQLLQDLREEKKAIWMTTHDIFRAKQIADRVGIMVAGDLVKTFTRDELEQADLEAVYVEYVSQPAEQAA